MDRRLNLILLMLSLGGLVASGPARAEEAPTDVWDLELEELLNVKVTVASRSEDTVVDAPSSVTVFTRQEIQNLGIVYLEELFNYVPGFAAERTDFTGTQWALQTRGFWGANDPAVLLLLDGLRVNEHFSGSFGFIDRLVSLGAVDRVEVIRGPGSALYGSNAFFGVVNIVTARDVDELIVEAGELSRKRVAVNIARDLGPVHVSGFVSLDEDEGQHYEPIHDPFGLTGETDDPRKATDVYLALTRGGFDLNVRYFEREFENYLLLGLPANDINRLDTEGLSLFASYAFRASEHFEGKVSTGYNDYHSSFFGRQYPEGEVFPHGDLLLGVEHDTRVMYVNLDMESPVTDDNTLVYGVSWEYADNPDAYFLANYDVLDFSKYLGGVVPQRDAARRAIADESRTVASVYVQDEHHFGRSFRAVLGVRFDHYDDFGNSLNPRAAFVYSNENGTTAKLMYGEAFLAPTLEKLYLQNNPFEIANPELDSQEIRTVELAVGQQFSSFQGMVTFFLNRETDVFEIGQDAEGSFLTVNGGANTSKGVELEWGAEIGEYVLVRGTATRILEGERAEASRTLASLIANLAIADVNVNLSGFYRGEARALPQQDAYVIVNGSVRYQFTEALSAQASASNLLDEEYVVYSRNGNNELPARGRQARLGVTFRF